MELKLTDTVRFALLVCLASLSPVVDSAPTQNQNLFDLRATSCNININTGPNKKLEGIILGMKRQLNEIQKELKNLTRKPENDSKG